MKQTMSPALAELVFLLGSLARPRECRRATEGTYCSGSKQQGRVACRVVCCDALGGEEGLFKGPLEHRA